MNKLIVFLCLMSFIFADLKIGATSFMTKTDHTNQVSLAYSYLSKGDLELSAFGKVYDGTSGDEYSLGIKSDWFYDKEFSPFIFGNYNKNEVLGSDYIRVGMGIAYLINDNILNYPFRNKFSVAIMRETGRDYYIVSLRYKIKGYYEKLGFNLTLGNIGYETSFNGILTYGINNSTKLKYELKYVILDGKEDYKSTAGLEIKI